MDQNNRAAATVESLSDRVTALAEHADHQAQNLHTVRMELFGLYGGIGMVLGVLGGLVAERYRWAGSIGALLGAGLGFAWAYWRLARLPIMGFTHYARERKRLNAEFWGPDWEIAAETVPAAEINIKPEESS